MDDLHLPPPRVVYRAMGRASVWERIGAGVMDKSGLAVDHPDYDPRTYSLVLILRGRGSYLDRAGRRWPLAAGDCFQRLPGEVHTTEIDPDSRWLETWVDLGPALFRALQAMQVIPSQPKAWRWGLSPARVARFTALIAELDRASERELPDLCVRCQALVVEALRAADQRGDRDPFDRLCRQLAEEAATRLDLRAFCRRAGLDYEVFRREFRRRVGVSPAQYRIRRRIERACVLLHTTDRPVGAIADELGYSSAYEFSAQFRARMGMPPSRYRAR